VKWGGESVEREPCNLIKLVRLAISDFVSINKHLEIERDPVRLLAVVLAVCIPEAEELIVKNICGVLFPDLFAQRPFNSVSKFKAATARVPGAVLIAAVCTSLCHNKVAVSIVAEIHDSYARVVKALSHTAIIPAGQYPGILKRQKGIGILSYMNDTIPTGGVSFEEEHLAAAPAVAGQQSSITKWVIAASGGSIKTEKQAQLTLLVIAGIGILVSLILVVSALRTPQPPPPSQIIDVASPGAMTR